MSKTPNHGYNEPDKGTTNWHKPLNENFSEYDTDIEIRDAAGNKENYEPKARAKFLGAITGIIYLGPVSKKPVFSIFVVIAVLLVVAAGGGGQTEQPEWSDEIFSMFEDIVAGYNDKVERGEISLGPAQSILHNRNVNLHVSDVDGSRAMYSFRMDKRGRIVDFERGKRADASLRMITTRQTIMDIAEAGDRPTAFRRAVRQGDIRFEGIGLLNFIVITVVMFSIREPLLAGGTGIVMGAGVVYVVAKVGTDIVYVGAKVSASFQNAALSLQRGLARGSTVARRMGARFSRLDIVNDLLDKLIQIEDKLIKFLMQFGTILTLLKVLVNQIVTTLKAIWDWFKDSLDLITQLVKQFGAKLELVRNWLEQKVSAGRKATIRRVFKRSR